MALILFVLVWACSPEPGASEPDDGATVAGPSPTPAATASTQTPATATTAAPATDDPFALAGPVDIQRDGTCNVNVYREDETGTTWLMFCAGFDPVGLPHAIRGFEHSAHFRYLVDDDRKRVGVLFESLKVGTPACPLFIPDFAPFEVPISDEIVFYEASLEGGDTCEGFVLTYEVTWDLETSAITIDGLLEPVD